MLLRLVSWPLAALLAAGCPSGDRLAGDEDTTDAAAEDGGGADVAADADSTGDATADETPTDGADVDDATDVPPVCGNGRLEYGEECDDGPRNSDTESGRCRVG